MVALRLTATRASFARGLSHDVLRAAPATAPLPRVVEPVVAELVRAEKSSVPDTAHVQDDPLPPAPVAADDGGAVAASLDVAVRALHRGASALGQPLPRCRALPDRRGVALA